MSGITFDTGALVALERRRKRIVQAYRIAVEDGLPVTVPAAVIVQWWRGPSEAREVILRGLCVEHLDEELAQLAGEALAAVPRANAVHAVVMASAARRGDLVYTSNPSDLGRLQGFFPNVRLLLV